MPWTKRLNACDLHCFEALPLRTFDDGKVADIRFAGSVKEIGIFSTSGGKSTSGEVEGKLFALGFVRGHLLFLSIRASLWMSRSHSEALTSKPL